MARPALQCEAARHLKEMGNAEIVIGVPSYNNARTIAHVIRAAQAGLSKYFPQCSAVIINSDGGSTDGTREQVMRAEIEQSHLLLLHTPLLPVHRIAVPYDGIPGKGSAFRLIFAMAQAAGAKACAVLDADLRSVTPEWISLLIRPVLHCGYDFVAPYYHRHKFDGTITNSIVYPLTRALYGHQVRQPIGGDFGLSGKLIVRYLERDDWDTDVARFGIDIWLTTIALAEGYRVCQSFLGAKLHDAKDPGADLSAMLHQVVGSVFQLMGEYEEAWRVVTASEPIDLFGFRFDVAVEPVQVDVDRMIQAFLQGCDNLAEVWALALEPSHLGAWLDLAARFRGQRAPFVVSDTLWVNTILDFACAYRRRHLERSLLVRSITPLYLARVAAFVLETWDHGSTEVEEKIERLCREFERQKAGLVARWHEETPPVTPEMGHRRESEQTASIPELEVKR